MNALLNQEQLEALAVNIARRVRGLPGQLWLHGNLGAGKSTFCRAWIQALSPGTRVKSPTYSLVEPYDLPDGPLYHLDLYRIADAEELEFLGLRDWLDKAQLLIEWPEKGTGFLPPPAMELWLVQEGDLRRCTLSIHHQGWRTALADLEQVWNGG